MSRVIIVDNGQYNPPSGPSLSLWSILAVVVIFIIAILYVWSSYANSGTSTASKPPGEQLGTYFFVTSTSCNASGLKVTIEGNPEYGGGYPINDEKISSYTGINVSNPLGNVTTFNAIGPEGGKEEVIGFKGTSCPKPNTYYSAYFTINYTIGASTYPVYYTASVGLSGTSS